MAATLQIDKMLETVVREKASDLHITTGQPPVLRLGGHMVRLETKTLTPEDTVGLMKSICPERNQQELQEVGGTDFGFAFGDKVTSGWSCGGFPTNSCRSSNSVFRWLFVI